MVTPKPPEQTFAGQPIDKLAQAVDQAFARGGLAGDRALLDAMRHELAVVQSGATLPAQVPAIYKGKKQLAFEAMLRGCNNTEAAIQAGLSRVQVQRYVADPAFMRALADARAERVAAAMQGIEDLVPLAVKRLRAVLTDPKASHRDVISAAGEVMDRAGIVARKGVELSGPGGGPVPLAVDVRDLAAMTPEQLRALAVVHEDAPLDVDSADDSPAEDTAQ